MLNGFLKLSFNLIFNYEVFFTPNIEKQKKQLFYYVSKTKSQKIINYLKLLQFTQT